jgi:hypothetical protein
MSEPEQFAISCPRCGIPMIAGQLRDPANVIHIESLCSLEGSSLDAWVCPACGHVELHASHPEDLAHHDIWDQDLGIEEKDWEDWEENR